MKVNCDSCGKEFEMNEFAALSAAIMHIDNRCEDCQSGKTLTKKESKMQEIPEHILIAAKDLCEYMPPNVLAELVDYWSDMEEYLPLAQIAYDEGCRNCGPEGLAAYIGLPVKKPSHNVLEEWSEAGVKVFKQPHGLKP